MKIYYYNNKPIPTTAIGVLQQYCFLHFVEAVIVKLQFNMTVIKNISTT